jgi:hypothetical protein
MVIVLNLYRDFEGQNCQTFSALLNCDVSAHFFADGVAARQPKADVVILLVIESYPVFEFQKRLEKELLALQGDANSCIDDLCLKDIDLLIIMD